MGLERRSGLLWALGSSLAASLAGCSDFDMAKDEALARPGASDAPALTDVDTVAPVVPLTVNVIPSQLRESGSDAFRVLPQTVSTAARQDATSVSLGEITLLAPVVQVGRILGYKVNPSVAAFPGEQGPIEGDVRLQVVGSLQSYFARTDALGGFDAWALPGTGYRLAVAPDDPLLPMYSAPFTVTDPAERIELDLGAGAPVYGRVSSARGPVVGARLHLMDGFGNVSAEVETDAFGLYQIRAAPGVWTAVCTGRGDGKDPTLTLSGLDVGEDGLLLDVTYPTGLEPAFLEGEVESEGGGELPFATVRLVAESLDGYAGLDAAWSYEAYVSGNTFLSPVVPGTYTIEVLPPDGSVDLSPTRITGATFGSGSNQLDPVTLVGVVSVNGQVRGPGGNPISSARVVCEEVGFGERAFDTFTDIQGRFALNVPQVPVSCLAEASGDKELLANRRITLDPSVDNSFGFDLTTGALVSGTVSTPNGPEAYVVIEVRDGADRVLGTGLTTTDGTFTIPVDLDSAL